MNDLNKPFLDLTQYVIDPTVLSAIFGSVARRHQVIPIDRIGNELIVACADSSAPQLIRGLARITSSQIVPAVALPADVHTAVEHYDPPEAE